DSLGRVSFLVSIWDWTFGGPSDIYFRVTVSGPRAILRQYGRDARWHGAWGTWTSAVIGRELASGFVRSVDGITPGYFPDYNRWNIGSASLPVVFNLGTTVFLRVEYETDGDAALV